jgi:chemosensory pili system protein ChpA (sensor histidine kinase/response regulator)
MNRSIDPEILSGFLDEAYGYLPAIRTGLAQFQSLPENSEPLVEVHRYLHTIKGAASMVGLTGLSHIAYQVEEAVEEVTRGSLTADLATFDALESGVAAIETYLNGIRNDRFPGDAFVRQTVSAMRRLRGLPESDDTSPAADALPVPNFSAFDTVLNLPALPDDNAETVSDGELPIPDFGAMSEQAPVVPALPEPISGRNDVSPELLEVFRLEAEDHLRVLTSVLPLARKEVIEKEQWQEVRRAAHTLKGAAAMVGFSQVTTLAHRMEDLLDLYFEGERTPVAEEVDLLLAATDAIEDTVAGRPTQLPALLAQFEAMAGPSVAAPMAPKPTPSVEPIEAKAPRTLRRETSEAYVRVPFEKLNDIVKLVGELLISRTAFEQRMGDFHRLLAELEPSTSRLRRASSKLDTQFEATALAGGKMFTGSRDGRYTGNFSGGSSTGDEFDALEFDRYTEFHLISRELAETTNDIQTLAGELGYLLGDFDGYLSRQARLGSEIEDKLMRLRMVPLSTVAARLHRTVRNATETTRKKAELVLVGERTGLDKTVLDAMNDPLLHLLRNAVDHGLESPEVRRALGKPETGTITLTAGHEGSQVVLTIADDGRGIDQERVRTRAVECGLLAPDAVIDEDQLLALLFEPGFSTKGDVSELSGRGVGLDVVKSKVDGLKGTVQVMSILGRGTTFIIRLPMTLAVTRALLVRTHQQTFAIPLDAVEQIIRLEESDVQQIGREPVVKVGEQVYPIVFLGRLLNLKTTADDSVRRPPVLLLRAGEKRLAVVVDQLLGGREIVIKSLGSHLKRLPAVSGATLMGDGTVVLILNPTEFARRSSTPTPVARTATPSGSMHGPGGRVVLVVDDSPSVRRVLTGLVERCGWTAVTAKDGLEALEILQRGQISPDIVLSDIEMPRMDGYELLGTIRSLPTGKRLPVVMITSRSADKHRTRAMDLGASAYVTKPYQDESLIELITQLTPHR